MAHWPQLFGSERVSTQTPPHCESPALHVTAHWPPLQLLVPFAASGHGLPQPPQFWTSVLVSTHALPHFARPPLHSKLHKPAAHFGVPPDGEAHTLPQPPQFCASLFTSTHEPEQDVLPPHSLAHLPAWQTSAAAQA